MKHPTLILTEEGTVRFARLRKEHGFLHDAKAKKTYAIVRDAIPTNRAGPWSRMYVVHERSGQTVRLKRPGAEDEAGEDAPVDGYTVHVDEPLRLVARVQLPGTHEGREMELTGEGIWDRVMSYQVRRLGNRRIPAAHAVMFAGLGAVLALMLVSFIFLTATMFGAGGGAEPADVGAVIDHGQGQGGTGGDVAPADDQDARDADFPKERGETDVRERESDAGA